METEVVTRSLAQLAECTGARVVGDETIEVSEVAALEEAGPGTIVFVDTPKLAAALICPAAAFVVAPALVETLSTKPLLVVDRPRLAFLKIIEVFRPQPAHEPGLNPSARVHPSATWGANPSFGPYAIIAAGARLGDNVRIHAHAHVGEECVIGDDCELFPHVVLYSRVQLGCRVRVHAGTVIGADGFGYEAEGGDIVKVPQVGTVLIEDDVEIGANCCIDRARLSTTVIGAGTKLDNQVQVAHNCRIGRHCLIAAQVGIAGGTVIADGVLIGGQAGFQPHITVGAGARIGGGAGVIGDVPPGVTYSGYPAGPHQEKLRMEAALRKLPELLKRLRRPS